MSCMKTYKQEANKLHCIALFYIYLPIHKFFLNEFNVQILT